MACAFARWALTALNRLASPCKGKLSFRRRLAAACSEDQGSWPPGVVGVTGGCCSGCCLARVNAGTRTLDAASSFRTLVVKTLDGPLMTPSVDRPRSPVPEGVLERQPSHVTFTAEAPTRRRESGLPFSRRPFCSGGGGGGADGRRIRSPRALGVLDPARESAGEPERRRGWKPRAARSASRGTTRPRRSPKGISRSRTSGE
jgi:hypothetical protein